MEAVHADWKEYLNLLICEENHLKHMDEYHKVRYGGRLPFSHTHTHTFKHVKLISVCVCPVPKGSAGHSGPAEADGH